MRDEPMRLLDRLIYLLFWRWAQCCAELPFKGRGGCSYCVRPKFHFGPHQTFNGEDF